MTMEIDGTRQVDSLRIPSGIVARKNMKSFGLSGEDTLFKDEHLETWNQGSDYRTKIYLEGGH